VLINAGKSGLSESFPSFWQYFLGALFIGAVLLFRMAWSVAVLGLRQRLARQTTPPPFAPADLANMIEVQQE